MRYELTDFEWAAIRPFLPNKPRGVPRVNDRRVLNGIFWILRSGAPWRNLPEGFWPYITCYNRFVRWRMAGIWDLIMEALAEAHDGCVQMIDTSIVRVHQHGGCAGGGDAYREKVLSIYGAPPRIQILDALIHVDPRHGLLREL